MSTASSWRTRRWLLALSAALLGIGLPAANAVPASSATQDASAVARQSAGCAAKPQLPAPAVTVPVRFLQAAGGEFPTVAVCLGTRGPYTFVVDTGSARSIIDPRLALSLHLKRAGRTALGGTGCATSGSLVKVPTLHAGNLVVARQAMLSSGLSDWGGTAVDGVLGSDVLGRFKALRLDVPQRMLTILGNEGPAPNAHSLVIGQPHATLPSPLLRGKVVGEVPLTIVNSPGASSVSAPLMVAGQGPYAFVIDSGAPRSTIDSTAGYTVHIANTSMAPAPAGIGCTGSVPLLSPSPVSAGSTSASLSMLSIHIPGQQRVGIVGYLGFDFLGQSGSVIIDYAGAELAFLSG